MEGGRIAAEASKTAIQPLWPSTTLPVLAGAINGCARAAHQVHLTDIAMATPLRPLTASHLPRIVRRADGGSRTLQACCQYSIAGRGLQVIFELKRYPGHSHAHAPWLGVRRHNSGRRTLGSA